MVHFIAERFQIFDWLHNFEGLDLEQTEERFFNQLADELGFLSWWRHIPGVDFVALDGDVVIDLRCPDFHTTNPNADELADIINHVWETGDFWVGKSHSDDRQQKTEPIFEMAL